MINEYTSDIAKAYECDRQGEDHWHREDEFIRNYIQSTTINEILDIPVGTGRFFQFYPKECKILGVDISSPMLEEAKKKKTHLENEHNISLILGNASNLNFIQNQSIDTIICCRLFHLVDDGVRKKILKEFSRIFKNRLVLQIYLSKPKKSIISRIIYKVKNIFNKFSTNAEKINTTFPWSHIKSYPLTERKLIKLLNYSNLKIEEKIHIANYLENEVAFFIISQQ